MLHTDSKKVKVWRESMDDRSHQLTKQSVEAVQEVGSTVLNSSASVVSSAKDVVSSAKDVVVDSVSNAKDVVVDSVSTTVASTVATVKESVSGKRGDKESSVLQDKEVSIAEGNSNLAQNKEKTPSSATEVVAEGADDVWELPSLWRCISTIFGGLLGY